MQPLIECKNTYFSPNSEQHVINGLSLTIHPGDFIVVLGGNGSGKSSLLKLLNRTYSYTAGDILFKQKALSEYDFSTLRHDIVTITQFIADSLFLDLTIAENAQLIESSYFHAKKEHFCKKTLITSLPTYLAQFNSKIAQLLNSPVKNLSGGEQQILAFALYLRRQPDLLLLDEHTSALDPKKSDQVMQFTQTIVEKKKITCLMTTHQLDYALKYGNRLIAIRDGNVVFDANAAEKSTLTMTDLLKYCY